MDRILEWIVMAVKVEVMSHLMERLLRNAVNLEHITFAINL